MLWALLACLALGGALPALAEPDAIEIEGGADWLDEAAALGGDGDALAIGIPDDALAFNGAEAEDESGTDVPEDEAEDEEPDAPVELSIRKSGSRTLTLGLSYRIVVPGKVIKTCKSSNKKVATVTADGLIETIKAGTAKITVTPKKGSKLTLKLTVIDPSAPTSVTIDAGIFAALTVGETLQLGATVSPETAVQEVTWSSSDKKVATVDATGLVTALQRGAAVITAATANRLTASLMLTVRNEPPEPRMISHAMGGIDGTVYSNCLEAFLENYREGYRLFEVDFRYTKDDKLVLWHKWDIPFCSKYKKNYVPTYKQFMESKIYDRYTPLDLNVFLKLMADYPDARFVIDGKYDASSTLKKEYKKIVSTAKALGCPEVLDRMIVELYNNAMYDAVRKIYPFKEYMAILYKEYPKGPSHAQFEKAAKFCQKNDIPTIALDIDWWDPWFTQAAGIYGLGVAYYTVNDARVAQQLLDEGVVAIFTDFLPPM